MGGVSGGRRGRKGERGVKGKGHSGQRVGVGIVGLGVGIVEWEEGGGVGGGLWRLGGGGSEGRESGGVGMGVKDERPRGERPRGESCSHCGSPGNPRARVTRKAAFLSI